MSISNDDRLTKDDIQRDDWIQSGKTGDVVLVKPEESAIKKLGPEADENSRSVSFVFAGLQTQDGKDVSLEIPIDVHFKPDAFNKDGSPTDETRAMLDQLHQSLQKYVEDEAAKRPEADLSGKTFDMAKNTIENTLNGQDELVKSATSIHTQPSILPTAEHEVQEVTPDAILAALNDLDNSDSAKPNANEGVDKPASQGEAVRQSGEIDPDSPEAQGALEEVQRRLQERGITPGM